LGGEKAQNYEIKCSCLFYLYLNNLNLEIIYSLKIIKGEKRKKRKIEREKITELRFRNGQ
jgi:hypothetical protein